MLDRMPGQVTMSDIVCDSPAGQNVDEELLAMQGAVR